MQNGDSHFGRESGSFLQNQTYSYYMIQNIMLPGINTKGVDNLCPHKTPHTDVYSSFIHNCQNLEATKVSFSKWINKFLYTQTMDIIQH